MTTIIENFEALLAAGRDNALLRYALANEYFKSGDPKKALDHLKIAVDLDPEYSAAWKLLGKTLTELARGHEAISAYEKGIEVANRKGDKQAAKEMEVFLRRLTTRP